MAREPHAGHSRRDRYEQRGRHRRSPYFITDDNVYFEGRLLKDASASTFKVLDDGYARDMWGVFYWGRKIEGASSESFRVLGYGYATDAWVVYYDGEKISGASSESFSILQDWYAKDMWNVYFDGKKISGAAPESFKVLREGYALDMWNVFRQLYSSATLSTQNVAPGVPVYGSPLPEENITIKCVGVASGVSHPTSLTGTILPLELRE